MRLRRFFLLAALLFHGACASAPPTGESESAQGPAIASQREDAALSRLLKKVELGERSYKISPGDLLEITLYREKDMDRVVRVGPKGTIVFPLLGRLKIGGLDTSVAERMLRRKLRKFLKNPEVFIVIKEYANRQVYILGEVQRPGPYLLSAEVSLSILELVTMAGGFTPYAALNRTRVIRKVDRSDHTFIVDMAAVMKKGEQSKDIILQPNDIVYVPERLF
ncbi:MAG: polysaccharide biosynthesis/export family protein [Elusimicrobia bacterium]|nr:polysaccharide biosynthesis/export family protein [Elusimicrobiota bacterium]